MKNKDFIKKSIEESIVNKKTVINNLKAKASVSIKERESLNARQNVGLKKAAIVFALLVVFSSLITCSIMLLNDQEPTIPPCSYISDTSEKSSNHVDNSSITEESVNSKEELSQCDISDPDEGSRWTHGESEDCETIINLPLDDDTAAFFDEFSEEFMVFQKILNSNIEYSIIPTDENYTRVIDIRFSELKDIKDFLYSFLSPDLAGLTYNYLTGGQAPRYKEIELVLNTNYNINKNDIVGIHTDTARIELQSDDKLVIRAMLLTENGQDYYHKFNFAKINDEWVYNDNWCS